MNAPDRPLDPVADTDREAPLLDLDTMLVRPTIKIDGAAFQILSPDELSVLDSHRFGKWGRRIKALAEADGEDEEQELQDLVDRVARKIGVGVAAEAYDKLTGAHKLAIVDVFTGLLLRNRLGVAEAIARAAGIPIGTTIGEALTGAKSSPSSNASTEATPDGGWWKRLMRSFAHI